MKNLLRSAMVRSRRRLESVLCSLPVASACGIALLFMLTGPAVPYCLAGDCYVGKSAFAVIEPYLIEKVCYLYSHEKRAYKPEGTESQFVQTLPTVELHPDPLHVEFMQMRADGKYLPLVRGTQVFNCQYDLELIKKDPLEARLKGYSMPEFACGGVTFPMVPVRLVNSNVCYWVAEAVVRCDVQVKFPTGPFDLFEEELREEWPGSR